MYRRVRRFFKTRQGKRVALAGRLVGSALALRYMPLLGRSMVRNSIRRHTARSAAHATGYSSAYRRSISANLARMSADRSYNGYVQPRVVFPSNPYRS